MVKRRWLVLVQSLVIASLPAWGAAVERVSIATDGAEGGSASYAPSVSADGRYVAFTSYSSNLVPGDTNGTLDVFVRDRLTATTERVSVSSSGMQGEGPSSNCVISGDGRYVAFRSDADLTFDDHNGLPDVYMHDRLTGVTERISKSDWGPGGAASSYSPSLSADGRYVAFESLSGLIQDDLNDVPDIYVLDRLTGVIEIASLTPEGGTADDRSYGPVISADGRYVAFGSFATNLVEKDENGGEDPNAGGDIFVRDRLTGMTEMASVSSAGAQGKVGVSEGKPGISADGRYVVFASPADNLVGGDGNERADVFVRDRLTGITTRASVTSSGLQANGGSIHPSISASGRYVAFESDADQLVADDGNGATDVFVRDRLALATAVVSISSSGSMGDGASGAACMAMDDSTVVFASQAGNLAPGDSNNNLDVFAAANPLFVQVALPLPPDELTATAVTRSQIDLGWRDRSDNETAFRIERSSSESGPFEQVGMAGPGVTSYADTGLPGSTTFYYRVCAVNGTGASAYSEVAQATTLLPPPVGPTDFVAIAVSSSQIDLSWTDNAQNEDSYSIWRYDILSGEWVQIALLGADATSYQDAGLLAGVTYTYNLQACNAAGDSPAAVASATTPNEPPAAPSDLMVAVYGPGQVILVWQDNSHNETRFEWERSTSPESGFTHIGTPEANATSDVDSGLPADVVYYYRVRACNAEGPSPYSNVAGVTVTASLPGAPSDLVATASSSRAVRLTWTDNADNEAGFIVDRQEGAGPYMQAASLPADCSSWVDTGCLPTTTYTYRLRATNGIGDSAEVEASATTPTFDDVLPTSAQWRYVEAIAREGITGGCSETPPLYCPGNAVTRGQMAVFLCRAAGWTPLEPATPSFADVAPTDPQYGYIEALKANGVTSGCGGGLYCPESPVNRGQMAVFLCRAAGVPTQDPATPSFADLRRTSGQYTYVEGIYAAGITAGCVTTRPRRYCPEAPVSRGQMAVFLCRAFGISTGP